MFLTLYKPLIYLALYLAATYRWYSPMRPHWYRPILATILRVGLGIFVGFGVGIALTNLGGGLAVSIAVMLPVRLALWFAATRPLYGAAPPKERLAFIVLATAVSFAIEFIDTAGDGYQHELDTFHMC